ncbi:MAG: hypothetical protein OHK0037_34650 [Elainellaceae cyanobacterium]
MMTAAPTLAQSGASGFALPSSVPSGTRININGSPSLSSINQALKQQFESRYAGTQVNLSADGAEDALQAVDAGRVDLAAIARPLTDAEKARGLVAVPAGRRKIAFIVGSNNPFNGSLSDEAVSQIYWGDVTDWSAFGGAPGAIRPIDRPEDSDLRRAIASYNKYRSRAFGSGGGVVRLNQDNTDELVRQLGNDGIGYAIADEVLVRTDVRPVPMDDVLPSDPRYPFSLPVYYVYKGPQPSEAAQVFLGYATDASVQASISPGASGAPVAPAPVPPVAVAPASPGAPASPVAPDASPVAPDTSPVVSPTAPAPGEPVPGEPAPGEPAPGETPAGTASPVPESPVESADEPAEGSGFPWFLLLAVPVLGGLLWWLFRKPEEEALLDLPGSSRLVLTPRSCRDIYAYWELSDADRSLLAEQGGRNLQLRLYDVTGQDASRADDSTMQQFDCDEDTQDFHIPVSEEARDYVAEVGYLSDEREWLSLARSAAVHVPACVPDVADGGWVESGVEPGAVPPVGMPAPAAPPIGAIAPSRIILVPRDERDAYVYWEVSEQRKEAARRNGGKVMALHLYDVTERETGGVLRPVRQFQCNESVPDCHIPIPQPYRDYLVELGYVTDDRRWIKLAQSEPVRVPAPSENSLTEDDPLSNLNLNDLGLDDLDLDL